MSGAVLRRACVSRGCEVFGAVTGRAPTTRAEYTRIFGGTEHCDHDFTGSNSMPRCSISRSSRKTASSIPCSNRTRAFSTRLLDEARATIAKRMPDDPDRSIYETACATRFSVRARFIARSNVGRE
jgi:hypothetical protein